VVAVKDGPEVLTPIKRRDDQPSGLHFRRLDADLEIPKRGSLYSLGTWRLDAFAALYRYFFKEKAYREGDLSG
jgi:hypothetical protein